MTTAAPTQDAILLVDDEADDILLTKRVFRQSGLAHPIYSVANGMGAIAYLNGNSPYQNRARYPLPAMILLDIKMPQIDGFEVLQWIRHQPAFANLPVVMLTASDQIQDVNTAYQLGANSVLVKPLDTASVVELSRSIERLNARLPWGLRPVARIRFLA